MNSIDLNKLGGKASNLSRLSKVRVNVPRWSVPETDLFDRFLDGGNLRQAISGECKAIGSDVSRASKAAEKIKAMVLSEKLPPAISQAILEKYQQFDKESFIAVRSSAVGEDAQGASFAGQHDSYLFIRGEDGVLDAVKRCWASAFTERALHYRIKNKLDMLNIRIAVILQEMIESEISGVLFTINPTSGRKSEMLISATYGIGEGIVSGQLETDVFEVPKSSKKEIRSTLVQKTEQVVFDKEKRTGTKTEPIPTDKQNAACLSKEQLVALVSAGRLMEKEFGVPQDIEFAFAKGRLYILQARPITAGLERPFRLTWDNSNIIESYSGVTSPLTFSFIRRAYAIVYHQFCQVMGIPDSIIFSNQSTFENMLGLIKGRVYYNLLNWYKLVSLFPGYQYNREFMEQMMGVKESLETEMDDEPSWWQRYFVDLPRLLKLVGRMIANFNRLEKLVGDFMNHFKGIYEHYDSLKFIDFPPHELLRSYEDMEQRLLWNWKAPIINDFFAMIFYGVVKKLVQTWNMDPEGTLQNDLLCGEGGIESTLPTKRLLEIASRVRANPEWVRLFKEKSDSELRTQFMEELQPEELSRGLLQFLKDYGFRCMNELKLEEPSLRDDPQFLIRMIRNYLDTPVKDSSEMERHEAGIRKKAEALARERLGSTRILGLIKRHTMFMWVLRHARACVKNRENMRFARTKIYGVLRGVFRAIGHHLVKEGKLAESHDVFFLTMDEIWGYVRGTAASTEFQKISSIRKEEFENYKNEELPDRFQTEGAVHGVSNASRLKVSDQIPTDGALRGIGCCPGQVTNHVKYVASPKDDLNIGGLILVAERTDPGWVPLYPTACGLLIERGSPLSHSAIVAREMGLPTIVGIPFLTKAVKTGDKVTMDGSTGVVKIIPS